MLRTSDHTSPQQLPQACHSADESAKMGKGDIVATFLQRLLRTQPNYIGIHQPGEFSSPTYRVIMPDSLRPGYARGRGYRGMREDVLLETPERGDIDLLISSIERLVGTPTGPVAVRHILNPSLGSDEGLRLIWATDGLKGKEEIADWHMRDLRVISGENMNAEGVSCTDQPDSTDQNAEGVASESVC